MYSVSSLWSSAGIQSRPTSELSGIADAKIARLTATITMGWSSDHARSRPYKFVHQPNNPDLCDSPCFSPVFFDGFKSIELSIGVSVKLTSIETSTENAMVQPN